MFSKVNPVIQNALYVFLFVVVSSVLAVSFSFVYMEDAYEDQQSAKRAMRIWKNKIDGSRESNRIVDEYETNYLALVRNGVIGEENRLNWFETIQAASEARGMPSVKYSIASQVKQDDKNYKNEFSGIGVFRSIMSLDIKMGHEGDLFAILNNLGDRAQGLFAIDKCDVERLLSDVGNTDKDNMKANCVLSWYTIKSADEG